MRIICLALCLIVAVPAAAADKVEFGPAPAWVRPFVLPSGGADPANIPIRAIIDDRHVRAEAGRIMVHSVVAVKFLAPDGLQGGNVAVQWRPDKDKVTVHKLAILRDGKSIDVLGAGQKFTILQREENLEASTLDGRLTATLQPEGLQVGDILLFEMTMTSSDPVMGRHVELFSGLADQASAGRIALRAEWPGELDVAWRASEMPAAQVRKANGWTSVEWKLDDPAPYVAPKSAPARFRMGRRVELSDARSWDQIAALVTPLFDRASVIPATGPLRDAVEKIRAASGDPVARAEAALMLVEDQVRYVALLMDSGNYTPADAATTWTRRFGDCKAKTALLTAILRDLGLAAAPVLVHSVGGDGLDQRLPMLAAFDHVIVRATINGRDYYLDGTRSGDSKLANLQIPAFQWGLPLVRDARLVRLVPTPLTQPQTETLIHVDASAGGGDRLAPTKVERIFRGDLALAFNLVMGKVPAGLRDKMLRDYWREQYSRLTVKTATASFDRAAAEYRLVAEGDMKLDLYGGRYEVDVPTLGYTPDFKRDPGPHKDAPIGLEYPDYTRNVQTIILPEGFASGKPSGAEPIDKVVAGIRYRRTISQKRQNFTIETSAQTLVPEIPLAEALSAEAELKRLDDDTYEVALAFPSKADVAEVLAQKPVTANDHLLRSSALIYDGRYSEAIVELDKVIALEPKRIEAFEARGFARLRTEDVAGAQKDFESAAALGSTLPSVLVVKAVEAGKAKRWDEALRHIDAALVKAPELLDLLMMRAEANRQRSDYAAALADSRRITSLYPANGQAFLFRINLLQRQGKRAEAVTEADALLKLKLSDPYGYVVAAKTYAANGRQADAMRAFDRALAVRPEGYVYVNRAEVRLASDMAGKSADYREGIKLEPDNADLRSAFGAHLARTGDLKGAMEQFTQAIAAEPTATDPRIARGVAYARMGQAARAEADFAFVRAEAEKDASVLNAMCWAKATAGVALESALADCNLALAIDADAPATLDSRGLVLLRLGQLDDAIASYDRALKPGPMAASLYGRALAWSRKGDASRASADAAAARALSKTITDQFAGYGLTLPSK